MAISRRESSRESEVGFPDIGETQIGSHGLRKRLLQRGSSWQTPFPGDEVEVHYRARVEHGECFSSSHEEGAPFRFKLGQCEVIKGLDEGIATMKKGERAIFTIPPELGYGELGSPPLIPQNSTLIFDVEMISWNSIRDITGDGGVLKKIIVEGEGWATPKDADEVLVKYEAMHQDGTVLSKSMTGVEFCIKNGYLCPAMSKAVKTMRKGEKAELSVKFSYPTHSFLDCFTQSGSGSVGFVRDATANSNLTIQLELLSWKSVIDITGDGKVLKKIVKVGEGFDHPNEGSLVKVIYVGKLEDGTIHERKGCEEEPFEYVCFEEQIHDGLDRAVMTMRKGERAVVTLSSDFVSDYETAGVASPDSVLLYEVELISFTKEKPFWKVGTEEKMEACERKKHEGNLLFKAGKFWRAAKKYEKELSPP